MPERLVIALGGNALQSGNSAPTAEAQLEVVRQTARRIAEISSRGYEMAVVHGNGPQVGRILLASETAKEVVPPMPFDVCGAMSQGYIGYHLQNAITRELQAQGLAKNVVTLVTQVEVDAADPAFKNPTKPIGAFYSKAEAKEKMAADPTCVFKEDAGRGWRKVVASPIPVDVVEKASILHLVDSGFLVIACGGGGIPVVKQGEGDYVGVPAVIDKDYASECLAEIVDADYLYILTAVDRVCINFNKPDQKEIKEMSCQEAEEYAQQGQFAPGSMLPKVNASMKFASSKAGRKAVICSLEKAALALTGESGTIVKQ